MTFIGGYQVNPAGDEYMRIVVSRMHFSGLQGKTENGRDESKHLQTVSDNHDKSSPTTSPSSTCIYQDLRQISI